MSLGWLVVKQAVACAAQIIAEHFVGHFGAVLAGVVGAEQPLVAVRCVELEPELAIEPAVAVREPVDGFVAGLVEGGLAD